MTPTPRKKLIEVALPLPEINDASAYDKMPGIGPHPKGIHQWWARLPLPTARAILFASVVDDPEAHPEKWPTEEAQSTERERLFEILRRMMAKKLHEAPEVYAEARKEMLKHCDGRLPVVFDPFAGGGMPLEVRHERRFANVHSHLRMAAHAEIAVRAAGLRVDRVLHCHEHRRELRVGMLRDRPLLEVARMAGLAGVRRGISILGKERQVRLGGLASRSGGLAPLVFRADRPGVGGGARL